VSVDKPDQVEAVRERLRQEKTVPGLLRVTAETYVEVLDGAACTISRVIGDLLVDLVQHQRDGDPDRLGHGYLISDYPLTRSVIEDREPKTVFNGDPKADPSEAELLVELGFESLLMVAIQGQEGPWGLVEVYGRGGRRFGDADAQLAQEIAERVGEVLTELQWRHH
jgi:GAF domain-containing protein